MSVGQMPSADGNRAELAVKTAPGTKDGTGAYLSTGSAAGATTAPLYRNSSGYTPDRARVDHGVPRVDGRQNGRRSTTRARGDVGAWGDTYGNRVDRFNGGMGVAEGRRRCHRGKPSIIQGRGYYTRLTVFFTHYRNGVLAKNWVYDQRYQIAQWRWRPLRDGGRHGQRR